MAEKRTKSNKKFMLLSAIGIFMVVDHHTFTAFNLFGDFLPYNSFFMPMFVFVSGYFNKVDSETKLSSYIVKKVKSLLIPYLGLSMAVFIIQQLINILKTGGKADPLPSGYLSFVAKRIVTVGTYGVMVEPMWFVISLFATLTVYAVLKKYLYKIWNSYVMLAVFIALHMLSVYISKNNAADAINSYLVPLKCMFFLPFLEMGSIYKKSIEKRHEALPGGVKLGLMFFLLLINAVRTLYLPNAYDVAFDSIDSMGGFTSPYIVTPLVSSLVGILFWLTFAELIEKKVSESRFVNFMSCNTFWIMGLHILFFNIFNVVLMAVNNHIVKLSYFDAEAFKDTEWYFWGIGDNIKVFYVFVGILGPLALKCLYDKAYAALCSKTEKAKLLVPVATAGILLFGIFVVASAVNKKVPEDIRNSENVVVQDNDDGNAGDSENDDGQDTGESIDSEDPESTDDSGEKDAVHGGPVLAYACVDLVYDDGGTETDYYSDFEAVDGDGEYSIKITRSDDEVIPAVFDGLSYMTIKLIKENEKANVSGAKISDIKVFCDGVPVTVISGETVPLSDEVCLAELSCYDSDSAAGSEKTENETFDFGKTNEIEVVFSVSIKTE